MRMGVKSSASFPRGGMVGIGTMVAKYPRRTTKVLSSHVNAPLEQDHPAFNAFDYRMHRNPPRLGKSILCKDPLAPDVLWKRQRRKLPALHPFHRPLFYHRSNRIRHDPASVMAANQKVYRPPSALVCTPQACPYLQCTTQFADRPPEARCSPLRSLPCCPNPLHPVPSSLHGCL